MNSSTFRKKKNKICCLLQEALPDFLNQTWVLNSPSSKLFHDRCAGFSLDTGSVLQRSNPSRGPVSFLPPVSARPTARHTGATAGAHG